MPRLDLEILLLGTAIVLLHHNGKKGPPSPFSPKGLSGGALKIVLWERLIQSDSGFD